MRGPRSAAALAIGFGAAVLFTAAAPDARSDHVSSSGLRHNCVWRATPSADPHPFLYDRFNSVAGISPREAWAVGDYFTGHEGGPHGAFIERWNGRRWRVAAAPIPRGATLQSVSASQAGDVWAVGMRGNLGHLIEHWNGARWRVVPAPQPGGLLHAVAARSPRDAWAVGTRKRGRRFETLIQHWNGTRWKVIPGRSPAAAPGQRSYAILQAVAALSPTDVWAAGVSVTGVPAVASRTLIEHWDGRRWTIVPSPNARSARGVTNDGLFSISGSRRDDVWAVGSWGGLRGGYGGKGDHTLALHWDGRRWSRTATPALGERALFFGVAARAGQAWAVGDRGLQPDQQTLIERWDGGRWLVVPSPAGFTFAAASASPDGVLWAVGARGRQALAARC